MLISRNWLQTYFAAPLPEASALAEALTFHVFEIDGVTKKGDDDVLDVKVTPNRGHDCLSHRGIARELSAILKLPLAHDPFEETPILAPITNTVSVTLSDATLCPRYIAGFVRNVKVGASPEWLRARLEAIGQRSINNVVDATNYVMFDLGQPLHAFDAGRLTQKDGTYNISVRSAKKGERITALDNKEYTLLESMLLIVDVNKEVAVGIAGVKGGTPAGITEETVDIIIESANFNAVSTRKTAQALKLRTDASTRFEQGLSPELTALGMRSVVDLILKIAGGELVGFVDVNLSQKSEARAKVSVDKINALLGTTLTAASVADVFVRLGFNYKEEAGMFEIVVPFERQDIIIAEDLIEEVGRIIGYDTVAAVPLPRHEKQVEVNADFYGAERVRESLVAEGYSEIFTSVFSEAGERAVLNKVDSVRPYLRTTLITGLEDALKKNIPNKDLLGLKQVKLFEIGTVWGKNDERMMVGTISEGEKTSEKPLEAVPAERYDALPISNTERFRPFSKYPYIVRDVAIWVSNGTEPVEVLLMIERGAGELLVHSGLFDQFEKAGKVSYAFRLVFQSFERTLTETEANEAMEKIYAILKAKGFEIR